MKKNSLVFSAVVAGLFATASFAAGEKAAKTEVPNVTKQQCEATTGNTWSKDKCWSTAAATKTETKTTTEQTAPAGAAAPTTTK